MALRGMGHKTHRADVPSDGETWDAIVLDPAADQSDPAIAWAQQQGLAVQSLAEFLYGLAKHKTRVVISGCPGRERIMSMIMHVLGYQGVEVDYFRGEGREGPGPVISLGEVNDFMVIQGDDLPASAIDPRPQFHLYRPNIALLAGMDPGPGTVPFGEGGGQDRYRQFVEGIVKGGSITYNAEDANLRALVKDSENPIRKFPYNIPAHKIQGDTLLLETPEGELPLQGFDGRDLLHMEGAKWICQQLGVDQAEFYEAMTTYEP